MRLRLMLCKSRVLVGRVSDGVVLERDVTLLPACPPPMEHAPSVRAALSRRMRSRPRVPLVSRPSAVAVPVALTTAFEAK